MSRFPRSVFEVFAALVVAVLLTARIGAHLLPDELYRPSSRIDSGSASIPSEPKVISCTPQCEIDLRRLATLSDAGHPGILPEQSIFVTQHQSGRYVLPSKALDRIIVFDKVGKIKELVDGGSRPFRMITNLLVAQDGSLRVYDTMNRTLSTLGSDFKVTGSTFLPYRPTLVLQGNRYLHAEQIRTPELIGQPLHVVNSDGTVARSFGAEESAYRADQPLRFNRIVAPSVDGMIWTAPQGSYVLERWDPTTGARRSKIAVTSTWFRESLRFSRPSEWPMPILTALWEADGYLWVLLRDADSKWKPSLNMEGERPFDLQEYERKHDFVLEVVDSKSGRVVASRRFDGALWGRSPSFIFATRRPPQPNGTTQIDVWKPELTRKEQ